MRLQMSEDYRGDISARQLRDNIIREAAGKKSATLKDMFVRYTSREMGNKTKKNYSVTWNTIAQFDKTSETLLLDDISRDWLERYNLFLINIGNCHNTRTVRIRHIAAVFNYAIDNELTTNYPFRRLDLSIEPTKKRDLKVEELREVFSANVKEKDRKLLDAFKVMFLLIGINVHDLYNLTRDNIVDGRLEYKRLKTGKQYSILIQPEVVEIMNKYPGKDRLFSFCEHYANASSFAMVTNILLKKIRAVNAGQKNLMLSLAKFNATIESAYEESAPHKICAYIYELANAFNGFYHDTKILSEENEELKKSYISLLVLTKEILEACIDMLGFSAPDRM